MQINYNEGTLCVAGVQFDPQLTLIDSAQVFHWKEIDGLYIGHSEGRAVQLCAEADGFSLFGVQEKDVSFWIHYFDLNRDYGELIRICGEYPVAQQAIGRLPGLRVLNQPAWEALIAFILSANNNVRRIRMLIDRLICSVGKNGFFPSPECLAKESETVLRSIGCGYRAPYLIRTADAICNGFPLERLASEPYEKAHAMLLTLPGVGDKVADCVQLFGLGHSQAFPVDVWVERLMKKWFMPETSSKKEIRRRAYDMFGEYAGLIQQSLFHCARLGLMPLEIEKQSNMEPRKAT